MTHRTETEIWWWDKLYFTSLWVTNHWIILFDIKFVQKKVCNIQTLKLVNSSILINMLNKLLCSGHCGLHMQTTTIWFERHCMTNHLKIKHWCQLKATNTRAIDQFIQFSHGGRKVTLIANGSCGVKRHEISTRIFVRIFQDLLPHPPSLFFRFSFWQLQFYSNISTL